MMDKEHFNTLELLKMMIKNFIIMVIIEFINIFLHFVLLFFHLKFFLFIFKKK